MQRTPLLPSSSARPRGTSVLLRVSVLSAVALTVVVACIMMASVSSRTPSVLLSKVSANVLARETKHVERTNSRLEAEDKDLALMAKQAEAELVAKQRKTALQAEKRRESQLKQENAALELANQQMKEKMLATRASLEKAEIANMRQKLKVAGGSGFAHPAAQQLHAKPVAPHSMHKVVQKHPASTSPLMALHKMQTQVKHSKTKISLQNLAGKYVNACEEGRGCHVAYVHESEEDWQAANHTHLVTQNGVGYPLGPVVRKPIDDFSVPLRDIVPGKSVHLGDNKLDFGDHDNYVSWEHSALNPETLLPPWRHNASAEEDTEGMETVNGFNGTREVYEALPFSGTTNRDWRKINLEKKGVLVDSWGKDWGIKHKWDGAGVDHWPQGPPEPKAVEWDKLEQPQWAWDNHAMKSQGWDPEGKLNKDLMLGVGWNETGGAFDDEFSTREEYKKKMEPHHGFLMQHEDHFADWEPNSTKNVRLLYGDSEVSRSMVWHPHLKIYTRDEWGLGDAHESAAVAAKQLHLRSAIQRTGEPFTDAVRGSGWMMTDGIATTANNIKGTAVEDEESSPTEPTKLEKLGVNV